MATERAKKVGHGVCPNRYCTAKDAYFSRSGGGKLKYECRRCDTSAFADQNGSGERGWLTGLIDPAEPADPQPTPAVKVPEPPKKRTAFELGSL